MNFEEQVIKIIQKNTGKKLDITPDKKLEEDLGIDSFDKLMIIAAFEDEFNVNVDVDEFADVVTVQDIIDKIEKHFDKA